jgi:serralysin
MDFLVIDIGSPNLIDRYVPDTADVALNSAQIEAFGWAISVRNDVANINLTVTTDLGSADISVGGYAHAPDDSNLGAFANYPLAYGAGDERNGDVWINNSNPTVINPTSGSVGWYTFVHELGHALGLQHPNELRA